LTANLTLDAFSADDIRQAHQQYFDSLPAQDSKITGVLFTLNSKAFVHVLEASTSAIIGLLRLLKEAPADSVLGRSLSNIKVCGVPQ